jgi:hypothetical protein
MTTSTPGGPPSRLSVPPKFAAPRPLTSAEVSALRAIADVLIPASGDNPAATSEPDFDAWLVRAVDARADAFGAIAAFLGQLVVAGAWLLTSTVRDRIGYPGQRRDPARFEEAVDQISGGILDPVIARGPVYTSDGTD